MNNCISKSAAAVVAVAAALSANAQTGNADAQLAEVTVTGSRVIMNGNDAPTPVTVVSVEDLAATKPTTIFESLAELPMFGGSGGATSLPSRNNPNESHQTAALNLRNLGSLRGLVLYDGHRMPPTTANGLVNINSMPQMLLNRVDIVTGGASAVYGSDAISGVMNFIVDRKFNGVKVNLQRGISTYNDDKSYEVGLAAGHDLFDGRGHIEGSWQRHFDEGVDDRETREFGRRQWTVQGNGTTIPWHLAEGVTKTDSTFGGMIRACTSVVGTCSLLNYTFNQNGILSPFRTGPSGASAGLASNVLQIGGDGTYQTKVSLKGKSEVDQLFLRFDYDLSDNVHASVSGSHAADYSYSSGINSRTNGAGWFVGACNPFLSSQYQVALGCTNPATQANSANPPRFLMSKVFNRYISEAQAQHIESEARNYFVLAELEGKFGNGYRWEAAYTKSEAQMTTRQTENINQGKLFAAIDAVVNPANGQVVCNVTLTNPGLYPGCVPINLFGPTSESKEAIDYIYDSTQYVSTTKLDSLSGSIAGAPFNNWAGPVDMALSGEYRRLTYELRSTAHLDDFLSCTGLRFTNCRAGTTTIITNPTADRPKVKQTAAEVAYEFNMSLLQELPFVKSLGLNSAARYTRYSNDNGAPADKRTINATTWKVGLTWDVADAFTVRMARSRDIRAPNLYDLFEPTQVRLNSFSTDYLTNTNPAGTSSQLGGNPNLLPEVAMTSTLGFIIRPTDSFSMAIDGYRIEIDEAITSVNGEDQQIQLACYASGGSSNYCGLMDRPFGCCANTTSANQVTRWYNRNINIAKLRTWGIDLETNFRTQLFDKSFTLRTLVSYQPHLIYDAPPNSKIDMAGVAYYPGGGGPVPVWRATVMAQYALTDQLTLNVSERYRSGLKWSADPKLLGVGGVASVAYTNLTLGYDIRGSSLGQFNVYLNVQNLFNKDPPPAGDLAQSENPGRAPNGYLIGDDVIGRYYNLGVKMRF